MMRVDLVAIIPAYNEEAVIAHTITSILDAGMSKDRVIVINDASKDKTAEIARSFGVVVIDNEVNLGKADGVTKTLRMLFSDARYREITHVSFLDADTLVDKKYFQEIRNRLKADLKKVEEFAKKGKSKKPISILCGRAKSIPYNWLTAFRAFEYCVSYSIYKPAQAKVRTTTVAPGCASTYSIQALRYVKWTHDTVVEDMDATLQVALSGGIIEYEKEAVVYTQDPSNIRDYVGQLSKRWYAGSWQVMGKHNLLWPTNRVVKYVGPLLFAFLLLYLVKTRSPYLVWMLGSLAAVSYIVSFVLVKIESLHDFLFPHHDLGIKYARLRLRWYCRAMNSEAFIYLGLILYLALSNPKALPWVLGVGYVVPIGAALFAAIHERRYDILIYSPIFPFISCFNLFLFVGKVGNVLGRKNSKRRQWFSPERYVTK